ncbi:TPA: dTMP kinase [Candidatus Micrarchaeota archaeon]|nr:dTMP kinase [Candidatus Micrarchaeota archaeon]
MPLIVFEGTDASGKKTQAELLVSTLNTKGQKVVLIDFPSYETPFGKLISKYLKGEFGQRENLPRKFVCLLYALDRYSRKGEIELLLKKGAIVILDRYTYANMAYQTVGLRPAERKKMLDWIEAVENGLPLANAVVFLDVPPGLSDRLLSARKSKIKGVTRDIHEKDRAFAKKVYSNYVRLAKEKKWVVVKCVKNGVLRDKRDIAGEVYRSLRQRKVL